MSVAPSQVHFRLQPYKQYILKKKKNKNLAPKFYGPQKINSQGWRIACELDFPSSHIHKVFYVSCLKKVLGHTMIVQTQLPKLNEEWNWILEPKNCIDRRSLYLKLE